MSFSSVFCARERLRILFNVIALGEEEDKHAAAQQILKVEGTPDYPVHLTELVLDQSWPAEMRVLASRKLKKYLKLHWCSTAAKFLQPEITQKNRATIKKLLPIGLRETEEEVREAVADTISSIVPWEWPHNWPQLFEMLLECLRDEHESSVLGGLRVMKDFIIRVADANMQSIGIVILEEMNRILKCENKYSVETRCLACEIFSELVSDRVMHDRDTIQKNVKSDVLLFTETSIHSWTSLKSDEELKITILKTVTMLMVKLPKYILEFLTRLLPLVWGTLIDCAKDYQANVVDAEDDPEFNSEKLMLAILAFIEDLLSSYHGSASNIPDFDLLEYKWFYLQDNYVPSDALDQLIMLMKITDTQVTQWNNDIDNFVEKEELKMYQEDGIRRTTEDLIDLISGYPERAIANGVVVVLMKHLCARNKVTQGNGDVEATQNGWKSREAVLKAFCLMRPTIVSRNARYLCYDIVPIFANVLADLNDPASHPLLVCRCLCLAGTYAAEIPREMASAFLEATINSLCGDKPACEKMCAAKAVYLWYYRDVSGKGNHHKEILKSKVPLLFEGLFDLVKPVENSLELLTLVLKSMASLMPFDEALTASMKSRIFSLALSMLLDHRAQSIHYFPWLSIFKELTVNPQCIRSLHQRLIPWLLPMMTAPPLENHRDDVTALEIVQTLVKHSPAPLSSLLINAVFPAVCNCMLTSDDWWCQHHGVEVIKTYLSVSPKQIIDYKDGRGKTGVQYIVQASNHFLKSDCEAHMVVQTCEVLSLLIEKSGCKLGENVDELLRALLSHAQRNESYICETLIVFAHLIGKQFGTVCDFLFRASGYPVRKIPLESIVAEGLCRHYMDFDVEDRQIVKLAFVKILEYGVSHLSSRVHEVTFEVDARTSVPLLVAICRLMTDNGESESECSTK